MTDEEIKEKYNQMAGTVVKAIQNRLENYEIGYHEIFNSWLSSDPWEMAQACVKKNLTIIGSCYDIPPKHAMFSGELLWEFVQKMRMETDSGVISRAIV